MRNPFSSLEKEINRGITKLGDGVKREITKQGDDVRQGLVSTVHQVENEAKASLHQAEDGIREGLEKIEDGLETELREVATEIETGWRLAQESVVREISGKSIRETLEIIDDVRHIALPNEVTITLGACVDRLYRHKRAA